MTHSATQNFYQKNKEYIDIICPKSMRDSLDNSSQQLNLIEEEDNDLTILFPESPGIINFKEKLKSNLQVNKCF